MDSVSVEKLRRFSMVNGMILLLYSLAEVSLKTPLEINPLGIPLIVNHPNFIGYGLLILSIYGLIRFYIYAISLGLNSMNARRRIRNGRLADGTMTADSMKQFEDRAKIDLMLKSMKL